MKKLDKAFKKHERLLWKQWFKSKNEENETNIFLLYRPWAENFYRKYVYKGDSKSNDSYYEEFVNLVKTNGVAYEKALEGLNVTVMRQRASFDCSEFEEFDRSVEAWRKVSFSCIWDSNGRRMIIRKEQSHDTCAIRCSASMIFSNDSVASTRGMKTRPPWRSPEN